MRESVPGGEGIKAFATKAVSLAAVIWHRVMHWQLSLPSQACICAMSWPAVMSPSGVSAEW